MRRILGLRQADFHGHGQVIGNRLAEDIDAPQLQFGAEQDMVEATLRAPAGEGRLRLRRDQPEVEAEVEAALEEAASTESGVSQSQLVSLKSEVETLKGELEAVRADPLEPEVDAVVVEPVSGLAQGEVAFVPARE